MHSMAPPPMRHIGGTSANDLVLLSVWENFVQHLSVTTSNYEMQSKSDN